MTYIEDFTLGPISEWANFNMAGLPPKTSLLLKQAVNDHHQQRSANFQFRPWTVYFAFLFQLLKKRFPQVVLDKLIKVQGEMVSNQWYMEKVLVQRSTLLFHLMIEPEAQEKDQFQNQRYIPNTRVITSFHQIWSKFYHQTLHDGICLDNLSC